MTSRFRTVVNEVFTKFAIIRTEASRSPLVIDVSWLTGRLEALSSKQPPYVAWVRGAGNIVTPPGGNSSCGTADLGIAVQPLYDARQSVFAIVCGKNEEDAENLWIDVLRAVSEALGKQGSPRTFRWVTQEEDVAAYEYGGSELVIQEFEWPLIIPAEEQPLAIVESFATGELLVP